jgi:hypothetical protein
MTNVHRCDDHARGWKRNLRARRERASESSRRRDSPTQ